MVFNTILTFGTYETVLPMTYSDKQKSEALKLYVELGTAEASRRTKVNPRTLKHWVQAAGLSQARAEKTETAREALAKERGEKRERLRNLLLDKAIDLINRMDEPHKDFRGKDADEVWWDKAPAGAVQNYATSVAILIDKYRLEMGEATNRGESNVTISDAESIIDQAIISLTDELNSRR
jgi:transposase